MVRRRQGYRTDLPGSFFDDLIAAIGASQAWAKDTPCSQVDTKLWFPEERDGMPERGYTALEECRRICRRCPVRERCLEEAMTDDIRYGVWGGLTENEREQLRKNRLKTADGSAG
jgi:WhiB family transcriptional regulator, redox-sensing transcriptional regulator